MKGICSFARIKLISNFLTRFLTAGSIDDDETMSNWAVASDWLVPTFGLIPLKVHHGRFVLLAVGMVCDVACLMVARTIDPSPGEIFEPTYPCLVLSTNNTPKR